MQWLLSTVECQRGLSAFTFRIAHAINSDSFSWVDVSHVLRSDQYILLLVTIVSGVDLHADDVKTSQRTVIVCYHAPSSSC